MISVRELLDQLAAEGAVPHTALERAAATKARDDVAIPWFIHAIVAFGSWVAALLLIAFLFILGVIETENALIGLGIALCFVAVGLRYLVARVAWLVQVPLALAVVGEVLLTIGVLSLLEAFEGRDGLSQALLVFVAVQLAMLLLYPDRLHRFISGWTSAVALCGLLLTNDLRFGAAVFTAALGWATMLVWERESTFSRRDAFARPLAYSLVPGLFSCLILLVVDGAPIGWPASLGLATALAYAAWYLCAGAAPVVRLAGVAAALLLLLPAWQVPGIIAATLVFVVGFSRGNRALIGFGGLFLVGFIGYYYESLDATLLMKSLYLAGSGALMLAARAAILRFAAP